MVSKLHNVNEHVHRIATFSTCPRRILNQILPRGVVLGLDRGGNETAIGKI